MGSEFFYDSYEIKTGKPSLDGLPASFGGAEDVTTLEITCVDPVLNLKLILSYSAFEKEDVITRSVKIVNTGKQQVRLEKVYIWIMRILNCSHFMAPGAESVISSVG